MASLNIGMEEIDRGGTDVRPTQIALVFDASCNCFGDTVLTNPSRLVGRGTPGRAPRGDTLQAEERGIRQPAIPATATVMATATATDGKHWVDGGVTSGGSGNGSLLWRITR